MENRFSGSEYGAEIETAKALWYLPTIRPEQDIQRILDEIQSPAVIGSATADQINEYIVRLLMYNMYLQQESNKLSSKLKFYKSNLEITIGDNLGETPYSFFGEKKLYILANDQAARGYDEHIMLLEGKLEMIKGYDRQINNVVDGLKQLAYTRGRMHA